MTRSLHIRNRQRTRAVDSAMLRKTTRCMLEDLLGLAEYDLGIHLVAAVEMAGANQQHLQHSGSTDVITFDYAEPGASLHGELLVCVDDAIAAAKEFKTTWQSEVVRSVVHGILHLRGFDDLSPAKRRVMKSEENRLVQELARRFPLSNLARRR